jgi:hypothetical protein
LQSLWSQNNQSLSELASVMATIKKQHPHGKGKHSAAPGAGFRDSALTALLRQSLGGDCKVGWIGGGGWSRHLL